MKNNIKKTRIQTAETKEKISNSQRLRFAKYKRALKENELRKLELKNEVDVDSLEGNEKLLELRFKLLDEFQELLDSMYNLFEQQIRMDRKKVKEQKMKEAMDKIDIGSVVDDTIKNYLDENLLNDEND